MIVLFIELSVNIRGGIMVVGIIKIKVHISWVNSLKEKRKVVKSISAKIRNKFNISVGEVEEQDTHRIIVLGLSCVSTNSSHADSMLDNVINYMESNMEGEIVGIERELLQI